MNTKADWINYLHLTAHPEGGFFRESYRNNQLFTDNKHYSGVRNLATSIYYMLESGQVSKLHRLKSDELWYFHYGSSLIVHVFHKQDYQAFVLGTDLKDHHMLQLTIPAGAIFGAEVKEPNAYTIMGCVVTPGFHFDDFELISRNHILEEYPKHRTIIEKLT